MHELVSRIAVPCAALLLGGCFSSARTVTPAELPAVLVERAGDDRLDTLEWVKVERTGDASSTFQAPAFAKVNEAPSGAPLALTVVDARHREVFRLADIRAVEVGYVNKPVELAVGTGLLVLGGAFIGLGIYALAAPTVSLGGGGGGRGINNLEGGLGLAAGLGLALPGIFLIADGASTPKAAPNPFTSLRVGPTGVSGRF